MIYVLILLFIILFISYICSNQSFFAPAVLVSGLWFVCTLLYLILDHGLNPLSDKFLIAISIWVTCFCAFSLFAQSFRATPTFKDMIPSKVARDIYFYFSLVTLPFLIFDVYVIFNSGFEGNIFSVLRYANVAGFEDKGIARTSVFFISFWLVSYIIELSNYSLENKKRVFILFGMNLFYAFISLAKTNFLALFLATISILYFKGIIKVRTIIFGFIILFFLFLGIQVLRTFNGGQLVLNEYISLYLFTGIPAFDTIKPSSSTNFGENTFRFIYAIKYKLGLSNIAPVNPILEFIKIKSNSKSPVYTNVYTALYPYYKDFGLIGISLFSSCNIYIKKNLHLFAGLFYLISIRILTKR